jgi:S1-C subfamily serine protease
MTDVLHAFSEALRQRTAAAEKLVSTIQLSHGRHATGTLWTADTVVASEQALPRREEFDVIAAGGTSLRTHVAGRDRGTNIAVLRLSQALPAPAVVAAEALAGSLAFAHGADGAGGATTRMGVVNSSGPEWVSMAGGRIDRRIILDMRLSDSEEGGPAFDAAGGCLGITTFGPRRQVLVIPALTIERIVPALLRDGRIERGWLGVSLQPVLVPDALRTQAGQAAGLMVMSLVEGGPAANAGVVAGDIVLALNNVATARFRSLSRQLGAESIGRKADLRLIRGGQVLSLEATIAARGAQC